MMNTVLVRLHTTTWSWLAGNSATALMATSPDDDTWGGLGYEGARGGQGAARRGRKRVEWFWAGRTVTAKSWRVVRVVKESQTAERAIQGCPKGLTPALVCAPSSPGPHQLHGLRHVWPPGFYALASTLWYRVPAWLCYSLACVYPARAAPPQCSRQYAQINTHHTPHAHAGRHSPVLASHTLTLASMTHPSTPPSPTPR